MQEFIARFSANASKSRQATSRKKQLDKITLDDIKPSSRKYPFVKFEMHRDLGNDLVKVENVSYSVDGEKILDNVSFIVRPGDKVAFYHVTPWLLLHYLISLPVRLSLIQVQ